MLAPTQKRRPFMLISIQETGKNQLEPGQESLVLL
jgi:hypothetical protein